MNYYNEKIILESYVTILQRYPSITKLLTEKEIETINKISSNLYNYQINDSSVICNHQMLLDSKADILSKKLFISKADVKRFIMNTKTTFNDLINPVVIESGDLEENLQSGFYIKNLESYIHLLKKESGYYLCKSDRVKLVEGLYKVYEQDLKITPNNYSIINKFLTEEYVKNLKSSNLTTTQKEYIKNQTLYALWEYTMKYPDNGFSADKWIFYRSKNNVLYSNDIDDTYLSLNGKLVISDGKKEEDLKWQPVKQLIFKNKK